VGVVYDIIARGAEHAFANGGLPRLLTLDRKTMNLLNGEISGGKDETGDVVRLFTSYGELDVKLGEECVLTAINPAATFPMTIEITTESTT
jgi:hypothetical protein